MSLEFMKFKFTKKTSEKPFFRYRIISNDPYSEKNDFNGNSVRYQIKQKSKNKYQFIYALGNEYILSYKPIEEIPELDGGITLELVCENELIPICSDTIPLYESWVKYYIFCKIKEYCKDNLGAFDYRTENKYKKALQTPVNPMGIGITRVFSTYVEVLENGTAYLSIETKCEFDSKLSVYDLILQHKSVVDIDVKCNWQPFDKTYRIVKVHDESIVDEIEGINLYNYWSNRGSRRLKNIDLTAPVISAYDKIKKRTGFYIPQSLKPVITREYIAEHDPKLSKVIDKYTKLSMEARLREIQSFLDVINCKDHIIDTTPLSVENFEFKVTDFSRDMPRLLIGGNRSVTFAQKSQAFTQGFYRVPDRVITAAYMSYDDDAQRCHDVVQAIMDYSRRKVSTNKYNLLLPFSIPNSFHYKKGDCLSYEEVAHEVKNTGKFNFSIAALPIEEDEEDFYNDSVASPYDSFKRVFADLNIPSQMVSVNMARELGTPNVEYRLQNLMLGILCKSGGIPWILEEFMDGVDCFIGLDVGTQEKGIHYPACSVCLDGRGNLVGFYSTNIAQSGEKIDTNTLEMIFNRVLTGYKNANGTYPHHIVIHRDGFSNEESEWYSQYFSRRSIEFDIVEIKKYVSSRLLDVNNFGNAMNPKAGVAAIRGNEAYLISTNVNAKLGSPRPLNIFHRHGNLSMDRIVRQIYVLSEMHLGSMRTSRLPLTTLYADKICKHHNHVPHDILSNNLYFI